MQEILKFKKFINTPLFYIENATKLAIDKGASSSFKSYVILFSPSAASFDQFQNFEQRGNKFKEIVNKQLKEILKK